MIYPMSHGFFLEHSGGIWVMRVVISHVRIGKPPSFTGESIGPRRQKRWITSVTMVDVFHDGRWDSTIHSPFCC